MVDILLAEAKAELEATKRELGLAEGREAVANSKVRFGNRELGLAEGRGQ